VLRHYPVYWHFLEVTGQALVTGADRTSTLTAPRSVSAARHREIEGLVEIDHQVDIVGRRVSPVDLYETARKSLHFIGYQGLSMIAVAGRRHGGLGRAGQSGGRALCVLLCGSVGPVNAYNSAEPLNRGTSTHAARPPQP
jgi:hypothetical protein